MTPYFRITIGVLAVIVLSMAAYIAEAALVSESDAQPVVPSTKIGRVFHDDFESGNTSKWAADGDRNKCTVVNGMARCNWDGVAAWNSPQSYETLRLNSWPFQSEWLLRFRVRYDANVDHKVNGKLLRLSGSNVQNSFYLAAQMEQWPCASPFIYFEFMNGTPGPKQWGSNSCLGDGKWHTVEIYVKRGVEQKVWVDDVLQSVSGDNTSQASWQPLYVNSNWSSNGPDSYHDANNHTYWDEFEIFSDTGSGGQGSMSAGTIVQLGTTTTPAPIAAPQAATLPTSSSADASCTPPTRRTDGAEITGPLSFDFYVSNVKGVFAAPPIKRTACEYDVTPPAPGTSSTTYIAVKAVENSLASSLSDALTIVKSTPATPPPPPPPATPVTIEAGAYSLDKSTNNTLKWVRVGTVPLGSACTDQSAKAGGIERNVIANRNLLKLAATEWPKQVFVTCEAR